MYGFKHIQYIDLPALPLDVTEAFTPNSLDAGRVYLGVSLAILISFMTYYVVTLSLELYRTIASLSSPLLRSTKEVLRSSVQTVNSYSSDATSLQPEMEGITKISSTSAPSADLDSSEDGASTSDGASQVDSHDGAPTVTLDGEGPRIPEDDIVEVPTEITSPEEFVDDARPTLADVNCHYPVEQAQSPRTEHEAPESQVDQAESTEHDVESLPIPDLTPVADISDEADILGSEQPNAGGLASASVGAEQAIDIAFDASLSFLLLPALPVTAGLEAGDDSLQPSAASVAVLATATHCVDLRPDDIAEEVQEESLAAVQSDDPAADIHTRDTAGSDAHSSDLVLAESTAEVITVEEDIPSPCEDVATVSIQVLEQPCEESITVAAEAVDILAGSDPVGVDDRIMESALLVGEVEPQGEQVISVSDVEHELDWTTVEREDCEVEQERVPQPETVTAHDGLLGAPEVAQQKAEFTLVRDGSVSVLTYRECAGTETLDVIRLPVPCEVPPPILLPPVAYEVPSVIIEPAPPLDTNPTATVSPPVADCPEIERTLCLTLLDVAACPVPLLDVAVGRVPAPTHVPVAPAPTHAPVAPAPIHASDLDDPADVYVGPLPDKPQRVRVHTEENPDWAVAPEQPRPQPKQTQSQPKQPQSQPEKPRSKPKPEQSQSKPKPKPPVSSGGGKNTSGNVKGGPTRKVSGPKQGPKSSGKPGGKDEQKKGAPARPPSAQRQRVSSAPSKTSGVLLWAAADPASAPGAPSKASAAPAKASGGSGTDKELTRRRSSRLA
ncbi:uncharacterized protein TRAVEDRAFT_67759 [Trametes versicolor FP-101664 SS1]|uniref:uncharacterized protein n=1 Tax=Trametes versicolor (strain FP-101664) TaxID=717944 RepID=UPI0004622F36|nr:uncharacterized protein TRAVEDRAFT_67759 [Trametes versicolor FP-101664 SS1]EIW63749.1 hypothetical protein TRAVEDRAFT_67759 [Trametes versicolor FP-101664 SS1]